MKTIFDCIIPYFNEELRPLSVVESILKVKHIGKVITVDDGSRDVKIYQTLKSKFPHVISLRLEKNGGKAEAVKEGIKHVGSSYVLLMDGDLTNIISEELNNAVEKITSNSSIDMIILRRIADKTVVISHFLRHDIIFSGQRILKTSDLKNVMKKTIASYNLESTINSYMIKNHKKVYWMPFSVHNLFKNEKWGYKEGIIKIGIPSFIGFMTSPNIIYQTLFFCHHEAPR